jgi:hypothetical protein
MNDPDVIEGTAELVPATQQQLDGNLFHSTDPAEVIARASQVADVLKNVLAQQGLTKNISGREHVLVEGWTTCGAMLGVVPVVAWTRQTEDGGWEARVEARTMDGRVIGAAEASCSRDENQWKNRDSYALRSMAQTRATSKALRGPLGFIVTLAGFTATPGEEMPADVPEPSGPKYGPAVNKQTAPHASSALTLLCGNNPDAAERVWNAIKKSLGYMPECVAGSLPTIASGLVDSE